MGVVVLTILVKIMMMSRTIGEGVVKKKWWGVSMDTRGGSSEKRLVIMGSLSLQEFTGGTVIKTEVYHLTPQSVFYNPIIMSLILETISWSFWSLFWSSIPFRHRICHLLYGPLHGNVSHPHDPSWLLADVSSSTGTIIRSSHGLSIIWSPPSAPNCPGPLAGIPGTLISASHSSRGEKIMLRMIAQVLRRSEYHPNIPSCHFSIDTTWDTDINMTHMTLTHIFFPSLFSTPVLIQEFFEWVSI